MKLTQAFIKRVTCKADMNKQEFYDDDLKGFMLEIRSNGRKTYFLKTTNPDGNRKSTKIADATILPLEEAKQKALKLKRSIEEGKEVLVDTPTSPHSSYRDWETDRKSTRLNSSPRSLSRMPSSA